LILQRDVLQKSGSSENACRREFDEKIPNWDEVMMPWRFAGPAVVKTRV
jgi:hypothetical protein